MTPAILIGAVLSIFIIGALSQAAQAQQESLLATTDSEMRDRLQKIRRRQKKIWEEFRASKHALHSRLRIAVEDIEKDDNEK